MGLLLLCGLGPEQACAAFGDRITVSGTQFLVGTNRLWINGVNTPWHRWNDFGGQFDADWWDQPTQDYEHAFQNGWQGVMAWTSNGVDKCGNLGDICPATRAFRAAHEQLVFPLGERVPSR